MRGHVYKRGSKWSVVYYDFKYDNGKWHQATKGGFITKKEAESYLRHKIEEIESAYSRQHSRASLSSFLNHWLQEYCIPSLKRNTVNGYRVNIEKHINPYIGKIPLYKLTPEHIESLYRQLREKGLSETSIRYVHNVLNCALNYAVKRRTIPHNILNYVVAPKRDSFNAATLTVNEAARLIDACAGTEIYLPILLAVLTGLRRGEVLGLSWADIDFHSNILSVNRTATYYKKELYLSDPKTNSSKRSLIIPSLLSDKLREYAAIPVNKQLNPNELVCCRSNGLPISSAVLNKQFKKVLSESKLPNIRFHDLRHTYATLMLKQQVSPKIVSSMLGHSSIGITLDTYSHVITEMQSPAIIAIDNLFDKR